MASVHMRKYSTSSVSREMPIKKLQWNTYNFKLIRIIIIKKMDKQA